MSQILKDPKIKEFINYARLECQKSGIRFELSPVEHFRYGKVTYGGNFDWGKSLRVAAGIQTDKWFTVLIHEFSHFIQWKNNSPLIEKKSNFMDWVNNYMDVSKNEIRKNYIISRNIELDAEQITVNLIKTWKLPIDCSNYVREANAYIYFYGYAYRNREWCRFSPGCYKQIKSLMSDKFLSDPDQYEYPPTGYDAAVKKYCL